MISDKDVQDFNCLSVCLSVSMKVNVFILLQFWLINLLRPQEE